MSCTSIIAVKQKNNSYKLSSFTLRFSYVKEVTSINITILNTTLTNYMIIKADTNQAILLKELDINKLIAHKLPTNKLNITFKTDREEICSEIYMWDHKDKIIISDIDGTVTKSTVRGVIYPLFGIKWHYRGIKKLYYKLISDGYKIIYLTAKPLDLKEQTRNYFNEINMPDGPIITRPTGWFESAYMELYGKPADIFKSEVLSDLNKLFEGDFHAGFGNKDTDCKAYKTCMSQSNIYIIENGVINDMYMSGYVDLMSYYDKLF
jgi:phosphatidate phosphatase LPIN